MGPLSCRARKRGSGCFEHPLLLHPHSHPGDPLALAPPAGSGRMFPASGRSRAPRGTARGQPRSQARLGTTRLCAGGALQLPIPAPLLGKARAGVFLDGQNQTGKEGKKEEGEGRGGERERRQLHGCRVSRTALHGPRGGFSLRFSGGRAAGSRRRRPGPARRGGETSVPARPAACPGAAPLTGT